MDQRKRYQIFVSSTFADLMEERQMVMQAILERKYFPAGMELFPAIDTEQFEYIKKVIDDSDYYLLIIGARYGSMDENGVSYTEKEYDYAVKKGIPVIAFLHSDIKSIPLGKADVDKELQEKLEKFRKKVQAERLVKYWKNPDDLKAKVISSLVDVVDEQPGNGWVRADKVISGDAQKEIERLQKDITKHLEKIDKLKAELKEKKANLKKKEVELKKKEADYHALDSSYQAAQQEIDNHKERIKTLEAEVKRLRASLPESQLLTETFTVRDVFFKMVFVKGDTFWMGASKGDEDADADEKPVHEVTLSDYWIGETQVTQALWQAVMGNNPSYFKGNLNRPVEWVSWNDCQEFIEKLNALTGKQFRLPTEAEWEFAARGGNKSKRYKYAGSNTLGDVAWYNDNSYDHGSGNTYYGTHAVATKAPNELGLYDMSGNVYEWCQDWYGRYSEAQTNPIGPAFGFDHVNRGGSWYSEDWDSRVSYRDSLTPTSTDYGLGLRLALTSL